MAHPNINERRAAVKALAAQGILASEIKRVVAAKFACSVSAVHSDLQSLGIIPDTAHSPATLIYALSDPRTGEIRYVGKTTRPGGRFLAHRNGHSAPQVRDWILSLRADGLAPAVTILEHVANGTDVTSRERWWVAEMERNGASLLNTYLLSKNKEATHA